VFSALEVFYENALYKFTFDIDIDICVLMYYSWHLMVTLSSLGYSHLLPVHHTAICTSYASQLESCGLWHWAIFVLLHLYDARR